MLLSDVDEGCGPFQYASGSHMKSADPRVKGFDKYGLSDEQVDSAAVKLPPRHCYPQIPQITQVPQITHNLCNL